MSGESTTTARMYCDQLTVSVQDESATFWDQSCALKVVGSK